MELTQSIEGGKAVISIDGWLDTQTAPELAGALSALGDEVDSLELDLANLEYVSSAGIREIVAAHKKMGGNLVVSHVSPEVAEIFRLTGVGNRLNIV